MDVTMLSIGRERPAEVSERELTAEVNEKRVAVLAV
jgi:hypothetical protein